MSKPLRPEWHGDTLQQIRWKVSRARILTEEADRLRENWFDDDFCTLRMEVDRESRLVQRIDSVSPPPPMYPILISEVAHQLRSALDHLIFALAKPRTAREEQFTKFPLCRTRKRFDDTKKSALVGVPKGVLGVVDSVQPYHRRKWPDVRYLGQLQALDNWCKHRALPVAAAHAASTAVTVEVIGEGTIGTQETFRGRIKPNKMICRVTPIGTWERGAKVHCYPKLGLYPVFGPEVDREIAGKGVRDVVTGAGAFIQEEVLPRFERFF